MQVSYIAFNLEYATLDVTRHWQYILCDTTLFPAEQLQCGALHHGVPAEGASGISA